MAAAAQPGRPIGQVAGRLAALGFLVPAGLTGMGAAERLGQGVDQIARRLSDLGFRVPDATGEAERDDLAIVSVEFAGSSSWLPMEWRVDSHHVIKVAGETNRSVGEVARRLSTLGFRVSEELSQAGDTQPGDRLMVTRELTGNPPFLPQWDADDLLVPVPVGHVVAVAMKLDRSIDQVARRLAQLGFLVSPALFAVGSPEPGDRVLTSRDLTGEWPWLESRTVPLGHLVTAAQRSGRTLEETAERLETLGFAVPPLPGRPVDVNDLILISRELAVLPPPDTLHVRRSSKRGWWLEEAAVPIWNVVTGAALTNMTVPQVVDSLRSLGFDVPEIPHPFDISGFSSATS